MEVWPIEGSIDWFLSMVVIQFNEWATTGFSTAAMTPPPADYEQVCQDRGEALWITMSLWSTNRPGKVEAMSSVYTLYYTSTEPCVETSPQMGGWRS